MGAGRVPPGLRRRATFFRPYGATVERPLLQAREYRRKRDAWAKTMADPALRADAAARGLAIRPVDWQVQQDLAARILATPDATVARLKTILGLE